MHKIQKTTLNLKGFIFILLMSHSAFTLNMPKEAIHTTYKIGIPYLGIDLFRTHQINSELYYGGIESFVLPIPSFYFGGGYRTYINPNLQMGIYLFCNLQSNIHVGLEGTYKRWEWIWNMNGNSNPEIKVGWNIFDEWSVALHFISVFQELGIHPFIWSITWHFTPYSSFNLKLMPNLDSTPGYLLGWQFNSSVKHSPLHKSLWRPLKRTILD